MCWYFLDLTNTFNTVDRLRTLEYTRVRDAALNLSKSYLQIKNSEHKQKNVLETIEK